MNETKRQPSISLGLARVYLNTTDPKLATRTWQEMMNHLVAKKKDETRVRWDTAIKDKNFDCIRVLRVAETRQSISTGSWPMARGPPTCTCAGFTITPWAWNGC